MQKLPTLSLFLCLFTLTACTAADQKPSPIMPIVQPMSYSEPAPTYSNPGSLYAVNDQIDLYADSRARRVGDVVLVNIVETNSASNSADTSTGRDSSMDMGVSAFLGAKELPIIGAIGTTQPIIGASTQSDFNGTGTTSRSNQITATVAARVVNVFPDGLMQVEGIRETRVNNETQYIAVMGLVRARDVQPDNSILSTQMADAQIQYYGSGVISDKQKPGWLTRLLDTISPF